jgi:hypothetical protein
MTFSQILDTPAALPGSMKEQLLAVAPYMVDYALKANGGFVINLKIPQEVFVTSTIDREMLIENEMQLCVSIEPHEPDLGAIIRRHPKYVDVELTYK